jgi:hypothetical protein
MVMGIAEWLEQEQLAREQWLKEQRESLATWQSTVQGNLSLHLFTMRQELEIFKGEMKEIIERSTKEIISEMRPPFSPPLGSHIYTVATPRAMEDSMKDVSLSGTTAAFVTLDEIPEVLEKELRDEFWRE